MLASCLHLLTPHLLYVLRGHYCSPRVVNGLGYPRVLDAAPAVVVLRVLQPAPSALNGPQGVIQGTLHTCGLHHNTHVQSNRRASTEHDGLCTDYAQSKHRVRKSKHRASDISITTFYIARPMTSEHKAGQMDVERWREGVGKVRTTSAASLSSPDSASATARVALLAADTYRS